MRHSSREHELGDFSYFFWASWFTALDVDRVKLWPSAALVPRHGNRFRVSVAIFNFDVAGIEETRPFFIVRLAKN